MVKSLFATTILLIVLCLNKEKAKKDRVSKAEPAENADRERGE